MKARHKLISIFLQFLYLGCTSFGGPVAHLGIFRQKFVENDKAITESEYASLVALCQIIPGPASSQVGMGLGYRFGGILGALAAWLGFTLPSALLMMLGGYWIVHDASTNGSWFIIAMKLVAVGVVTQAVLVMWQQLCQSREMKLVALISAIIFYIFPTAWMQAVLITIALVAGLLLRQRPEIMNLSEFLSVKRGLITAILWLSGVACAVGWLTDDPWLNLIFGHYLSGALVFGGGHVVLPLLESEFVPPLPLNTFLTGYGLAQAMPGPLFTIAAYIGVVAIQSDPFFASLCAILAIFLPGALLLIAALTIGQRLIVEMQQNMVYVNAVVAGLLLSVLVNPIYTGSVYSGSTAILALLSLIITVGFKRSHLELVCIMTASTFIFDLVKWI